MTEFSDDPAGNPQNDKTIPVSIPGWSIRPVSEDDVPTLAQIEARVHVAPWTKENFESEMKKPFCNLLVMTDDETDEQIAGYITYWTLLEDCHILNVATDLPYRGRGIAKLLVRKAIQDALQKGSKRVILEVRKSNQAAIGLYQTLGFTISHVRKAFYSNGEDAYSMSLDLTGSQEISF